MGVHPRDDRGPPSKGNLVLLGLMARRVVPIVEDHNAFSGQGTGPKREMRMLLQEWRGATTGHVAFGLSLWAPAETAKPAQVPIGAGLEYEDLDLVVGYPNVAVWNELSSAKNIEANPAAGL